MGFARHNFFGGKLVACFFGIFVPYGSTVDHKLLHHVKTITDMGSTTSPRKQKGSH
jgi:hypothetical protein